MDNITKILVYLGAGLSVLAGGYAYDQIKNADLCFSVVPVDIFGTTTDNCLSKKQIKDKENEVFDRIQKDIADLATQRFFVEYAGYSLKEAGCENAGFINYNGDLMKSLLVLKEKELKPEDFNVLNAENKFVKIKNLCK